jgi:Flp pilus assembly protein TadD
MSQILKRLNNNENGSAVLRPAAQVHSHRVRRASSTKRKFFLFVAIAFSSAVLAYQIKTRVLPAFQTAGTPSFTTEELQNQKNQSGIEAFQAGDAKKSITIFKSLVKEQPNRPEFHMNLAMAFAKDGHFDLAQEALQVAVKLDPKNSYAFNNLGMIALQTKQQGLAEESFLKALALNPTSPEILFNLASFYEKTGDLGRSIASYEQFVQKPTANKTTVEQVKRRLPRLHSLSAQLLREEGGL